MAFNTKQPTHELLNFKSNLRKFDIIVTYKYASMVKAIIPNHFREFGQNILETERNVWAVCETTSFS